MAHWRTVCQLEDLQEGRGHEVVVNGRPLALFLDQGELFALEDRCPHREGQLSAGRVENGEAICPLHGWNFDLRSGISPYNPNDQVATYPVRIAEENRVQVDCDQIPPLPSSSFAGYLGRWRRWADDSRGKAEVRRLAKGQEAALGAMGSERHGLNAIVDLDHFNLRAGQLARMPLLESEPVVVGVTLGRGAGSPLRLTLPAYVSHISFGAISREAKVALARGARAAGTLIGSGEGGMLPAEREAAGLYILEMASAYFGWNEEAMERADAFEVKLGQAAKPGLGGELPATKVTAEIARVRGIEAGSRAHSPARFPDIGDSGELGERIAGLRTRFPLKPIGIKLAANDVAADVASALALGPDFITLDGFGGGTGATPANVRDHFGMPLPVALPIARRLVDAHNHAHPARPVSLVATGGIRTPLDILKALALGADACALATAPLFALGCEYYRACHSGHCPTGIATQDEGLRARLDPELGAERVTNFFIGTRAALEGHLRQMGCRTLEELDTAALIPLSHEAAAALAGP